MKAIILSEELISEFYKIKREIDRHGGELELHKGNADVLVIILNGERDFRVFLTLSAITFRCSKSMAFIKSRTIRGIDNWYIAFNELRKYYSPLSTRTIAFIGDVDNEERLSRFLSTLKSNYEELDGVYRYNLGDMTLLFAFNGDLNNTKFEKHEIEEDIIKFLEAIGEFEKRIKYLIGNCVSRSTDPKNVYEFCIKEYKRNKITYGSEFFDDLDSLLVHLVITHRSYAEQAFYGISRLLKTIQSQ